MSVPIHRPHPNFDPEHSSLLAEVSELWAGSRDVVEGWLKLFSLETRLAALSLARIVVIALFMAVAAAAVWFALMTAFALWLAGIGVAWPVVFLGVAACSAAAVGLGYWVMRRLSRDLLFSAARAHLGGSIDTGVGADVES